MKSCLRFVALSACFVFPFLAFAQPAPKSASLPKPTEKLVYKKAGDTELELWIWKPADWKATDRRSAIVFYHGGGWRSGSPTAFARQSARLSARGMVAVSVQYRLTTQPGVTVADCVKDAKSAFRWIRAHAAELGINPEKIAAGGGSAGGHLAAALATLAAINDDQDDAKIATRPAALVLFNPALKLGGMRAEPVTRFGDAATVRALDPFEHLQAGHPPTIIFHGEDDTTVPIASVRAYAAKAESLGIDCKVVAFDGQAHSFFNREPFVGDTLKQAETFLEKHGLLSASSMSTAAAPGSSTAKFASARMLGVRRLIPRKNTESAQAPADGVTFAVLVAPTTEAVEDRSLKETRDILVAGKSYQEKTRAALGRVFEPQTVVHDAEKFFAATPALANGEGSPPNGSYVLTMTFAGAELEAGAPIELTLHAGYLKQPDTFVLRAKVPPTR